MTRIVIIYLAALSAVTFCLYVIDKLFAKMGMWRIPERWLLVVACAGGAAGAMAAMLVVRHKTQHKKFIYVVPVALVLQIALCGALLLA